MAPINLPWNKHEIALLLAYCIMIYNGAISMKNAISILSKRLRYSMEKMGIKVSETYRNENGIALQIQSMNCCLFGAKKGIKCKTLLFKDIASLYNSDKKVFAELLECAIRKYPFVKLDAICDGTVNVDLVECYLKKMLHDLQNNKRKNIIKKDSMIGSTRKYPIIINSNYRYMDMWDKMLDNIYKFFNQGNNKFPLVLLFNSFRIDLKNINVCNIAELKQLLQETYPSWIFIDYNIIYIDKTPYSDEYANTIIDNHGEDEINEPKKLVEPNEKIDSENVADDYYVIELNSDKNENKKAIDYELSTKIVDYIKEKEIQNIHTIPIVNIYYAFKEDLIWQGIGNVYELKKRLKCTFPNWKFYKFDIMIERSYSNEYDVHYYAISSKRNLNDKESVFSDTDDKNADKVKNYYPKLTNSLKWRIKERVSLTLADQNVVSLENIYIYYKKELNEIGICGYNDLKEMLNVVFPQCKFDKNKLISIEEKQPSKCNDLSENILGYNNILAKTNKFQNLDNHNELKDKIYRFVIEKQQNKAVSISFKTIYLEFKQDLAKKRIYNYISLREKLKEWFKEWSFTSSHIVILKFNHDRIPHVSNDIESNVKRINIVKSKISEDIDKHTIEENEKVCLITKIDKQEDKENQSVSNIKEDATSMLEKVLYTKFAVGYRLGSIIERKKLMRFYKEISGEDLDVIPENIDDLVSKYGIVYNIKVYFPKLMLSDNYRNTLQKYITELFDGGLEYIDYSVILSKFHDEFLDSQIGNKDLLKEYMNYYFPKWIFKKEYVCVDSRVEPNVEEEVIAFVKAQGCPVSESAVKTGLYHISEDKIHQIFSSNTNILISTSRSSERFHIDNFEITDNDLFKIYDILDRAIKEEEYMSWSDLCSYINNNIKSIFSQNLLISEIGIRNALKVILAKRYKFSGNVISFIDRDISVERIVQNYIRNHDIFTINEMLELTSNFGTSLYWDVMLSLAVRINATTFVSKEHISFDIIGIDNLLTDICGEEYIPTESVNEFSAFPKCGYQWNSYLLENYVACYSHKFKIIHNGFHRTMVKGAIVNRKSNILSLSDIILDILIKAPKSYSSDEIIDVLKNDGYIARSRFGSIDQIVERAAIMRQNI